MHLIMPIFVMAHVQRIRFPVKNMLLVDTVRYSCPHPKNMCASNSE